MAFSTLKSGTSFIWFRVILFCIGLMFLNSIIQCHEQKDLDKRLEKGRRLFESGNLIPAAEILEEIVKTRHDSESVKGMLFTCYRFIGIEYYGLSRYEDAIKSWEKALKVYPDNREIRDYISRVKSELKSIAIISGDTATAMKFTEPLPGPGKIRVDTVMVSLPPEIDSVYIPTIGEDHSQPGKKLSIGISSGIANAKGESVEPGTGMVFGGYIIYLPRDNWFGVRLSGSYIRFYRNSIGTTSSSKHHTISGIGLDALARKSISRQLSALLHAGVGMYEIVNTTPIENQLSTLTDRSSGFGFSLGFTLQKDLGSVFATVGASYLHCGSIDNLNLVKFSIGISSF